MKKLKHITLNTNHVAHTSRDDVQQYAIDYATDLINNSLKNGKVKILDGEEHYFKCTTRDKILECEVFLRDTLLVSFTVTVAQNVCAVQLYDLAVDLSATAWLGDFERCIAWAWIETNS